MASEPPHTAEVKIELSNLNQKLDMLASLVAAALDAGISGEWSVVERDARINRWQVEKLKACVQEGFAMEKTRRLLLCGRSRPKDGLRGKHFLPAPGQGGVTNHLRMCSTRTEARRLSAAGSEGIWRSG